MLNKRTWLSVGFVLLGTHSAVAAQQALVYQGPGSCDEQCSESAAEAARQAGFDPVFVGPTDNDPALFDNAAVWVQPGGKASVAANAMSSALKSRIKEFVRAGGGFVGFCAGGFLATSKIGNLDEAGLGLIPGRSALYKKIDDEATMLQIGWSSKIRHLYWEGGPAFYPPLGGAGVEIMATYPDGAAASVRAQYGAGRVYVSGPHPEAPQSWRDFFGLTDEDGLDYDLAAAMVRWVARQE